METKRLLACVLFAFSFASCSDDPTPGPQPQPEPAASGVFILNSGNMNSNDATLDYYDPETRTLTSKVFSSLNGRKLGDTANDMLVYGSKAYIALTGSNLIEVIDLAGHSLASLSPKDDAGQPQSPRCLTAGEGKVYVTLYDGHLACIDTTALEITRKVEVGLNPEGVAATGGKLYVAISGGYMDMDSTLAVVDAASFTVTGKLRVAVNPKWVEADSQGDLYVISLGNYDDIPASLQRIDPRTNASSVILTNENILAAISDDKMYILSSESNESTGWMAGHTQFIIYDTRTEERATPNFITDGTEIAQVYCISVDAAGAIYIGASDYVNTGDMYVLSPEGRLVDRFGVSGINPMGAFFVTR
jgi:DNA-binding beta-propeller fold protein YncE